MSEKKENKSTWPLCQVEKVKKKDHYFQNAHFIFQRYKFKKYLENVFLLRVW